MKVIQLNNKWFWVPIFSVILLTLFLLVSAQTLLPTQGKTVSIAEVVKNGGKSGRTWVLQGTLDGKSLYHRPYDKSLEFQLKSVDGLRLTVIYKGPTPKGLSNNVEVIVSGKYTIEGVFLAEKIWAVCF